jgi:hypothetical protein
MNDEEARNIGKELEAKLEALSKAYPEEMKRFQEELKKETESKYPILKVRRLLEDKIRSVGGEVVGGGLGFGGADFQFILEGQDYWVDIRPVDDKE